MFPAAAISTISCTYSIHEICAEPEQTNRQVLKFALKCADVGHLALDWPGHLRWVQRLEEDRPKVRKEYDMIVLLDSTSTAA